MTDDRREEILNRIHAVLESISGAASVWRNRDSLTDEEITSLPALILLDGREEQLSGLMEQQIERKWKTQGPTIMRLLPEVVVQLYPRITPQQLNVASDTNQTPAPTGPELSSWRNKVMTAILTDSELVGDPTGRDRGHVGLITNTGSIHYLGCETDYRVNSPMTGMMMIGFEIRYPLQP